MRFISIGVAILVGLLILLGYFLPYEPLRAVRVVLLQWGLILSAFALLVGVANLAGVHTVKVREQETGWGYSLLLLVSLALTVIIVGYFGQAHPASLWIYNNIQIAIESSLVALLAIVLIYAAVRMFRRRPTGQTVLFLVSVVLVLLGTTPIFGMVEVDAFQRLREILVQVPAVGGARGILFGVALGTIATGLRILIGADRPYGG